MTCKECLAALETESLREMTPDSPVMQHCARCADCARVTTMLREKEYETATVLNTLPPMSNPLTVAETGVRTAKRRRVGRIAVMISGVALVGVIWIAAATIAIPAFTGDRKARSSVRTERILLMCMSGQEAGKLIHPYFQSKYSRYYFSSGENAAMTMRGTPEELAKARDLLRAFEQGRDVDPRLGYIVCRSGGSVSRPGENASEVTPDFGEGRSRGDEPPGPAKRRGPEAP
jgi:hypothetical protein